MRNRYVLPPLRKKRFGLSIEILEDRRLLSRTSHELILPLLAPLERQILLLSTIVESPKPAAARPDRPSTSADKSDAGAPALQEERTLEPVIMVQRAAVAADRGGKPVKMADTNHVATAITDAVKPPLPNDSAPIPAKTVESVRVSDQAQKAASIPQSKLTDSGENADLVRPARDINLEPKPALVVRGQDATRGASEGMTTKSDGLPGDHPVSRDASVVARSPDRATTEGPSEHPSGLERQNQSVGIMDQSTAPVGELTAHEVKMTSRDPHADRESQPGATALQTAAGDQSPQATSTTLPASEAATHRESLDQAAAALAQRAAQGARNSAAFVSGALARRQAELDFVGSLSAAVDRGSSAGLQAAAVDRVLELPVPGEAAEDAGIDMPALPQQGSGLLCGIMAADKQVLEGALQDFLQQLDELSQGIGSSMGGLGMSPWLLGTMIAATAYEVGRRRKRPTRPVLGLANGAEASTLTWFGGLPGRLTTEES